MAIENKCAKLTESLAEYDRQQETLMKENQRLLKENEELESALEDAQRERDTVKDDLAQTLRELGDI